MAIKRRENGPPTENQNSRTPTFFAFPTTQWGPLSKNAGQKVGARASY